MLRKVASKKFIRHCHRHIKSNNRRIVAELALVILSYCDTDGYIIFPTSLLQIMLCKPNIFIADNVVQTKSAASAK